MIARAPPTAYQLMNNIRKGRIFDEKDSSLGIVMEYADDGDLSTKIKNNLKRHVQFDENTIWNILIQILEGINYLHKSKIIHRDLKSANIFLNKKGIVKIGDLNVSIIAKKKFFHFKYYWKDKLKCAIINLSVVSIFVYAK